jgi:hypothetical protein
VVQRGGELVRGGWDGTMGNGNGNAERIWHLHPARALSVVSCQLSVVRHAGVFPHFHRGSGSERGEL